MHVHHAADTPVPLVGAALYGRTVLPVQVSPWPTAAIPMENPYGESLMQL